MSRYVGKYTRKSSPKFRIPLISWMLILVAILGLLVGGVAAYLSAYTDAVSNTFVADAPTDPSVVEDPFPEESDKKTNVKVDVGKPGYAVYVRAVVVVTWKDADGNVLGVAPIAGTDYSIEYNLADWLYRESDGFYYYRKAVAYDGSNDESTLTSNLINSCQPIEGKTPPGYGLNVEIVAQTVQAVGKTDPDSNKNELDAVFEAWGVTPDDIKSDQNS